ncbi:MAG: hypothetical protein ACLQGP_09970 [Isosphaeraceae bacterium]
MTRPVVRAKVQAVDGAFHEDEFLIDIGADRTVFSTFLLRKLGFPITPSPEGLVLEGVGGGCGFVAMKTVVELTHDSGGPARIRGEFAAFTNPTATDLSILGRDVLNCFDLIVSYPAKRSCCWPATIAIASSPPETQSRDPDRPLGRPQVSSRETFGPVPGGVGDHSGEPLRLQPVNITEILANITEILANITDGPA